MTKIEQLVNGLITKFVQLFRLDKFKDTVGDAMSNSYDKGLQQSEKEFDMNFMPNVQSKVNLTELGTEGLKDFETQMMDKLKGELMRGMVDGETNFQIKKRLTDFFSKRPNPSRFNWEDRLEMILRTEKNRARNLGVMDGAVQSGFKGLKKWLLVTEDQRTSNICMAEHVKYGSKEKSIPLDKEFIIKVDNKVYRQKRPPFHPNSFMPDHDLLTETGWKRIGEVQVGEKVISLNLETLDLEKVKVIKTHKHLHERMIHFSNVNFDMCVTDDHDMLFQNDWDRKAHPLEWGFRKAQDIVKIQSGRFYRSSMWKGKSPIKTYQIVS